MKRPKRAIRIVRRKKEHGNPKDFDELVIMPFQGNVIAQIGAVSYTHLTLPTILLV